MAMLGMGNGAVFQLVPQRFPDRVGILTGIVGAAGGLGGFLLPSLLGMMKERTGSFGLGFAMLAAIAGCGFVSLLFMRRTWRHSWPRESVLRAGLTPAQPRVMVVGES
jgi:MFS transporter, NNP family, nitrate/nitrite transporter